MVHRLRSLDAFRGLTIATMILVNNPGSWSHVYPLLDHAEWAGCTVADLVFPFFIFSMGVSMYLSYRKFDFALTWQTVLKSLRRSLLLLLLAYGLLFVSWLSRSIYADNWVEHMLAWPGQLRLMGVIPRLAIVSFLGSLLLLWLKPERLRWAIAVLLVGYWALLEFTHSWTLSPDNIIARVDLALLGENHMYHLTTEAGERIAFDPEGLLSTIPCIAQVLLGAWVGSLISSEESREVQLRTLVLRGASFLILGLTLTLFVPCVKTIWTPSYVFITTGAAMLLLALMTWLIDVRGYARWCRPLEAFGVNPLFLYTLSALWVYLMQAIRFTLHSALCTLHSFTPWSWYYTCCMSPLFGDTLGSAMSALTLVLLLWCIAYPLYRRHIYIKL